MKRAVITILALTLVSGCLSACGEKQDEIVRIEASNAAGSASGTERKYEDTNKEPVIRPDEREKETTPIEDNTEIIDNAIDMAPTIYGVWNATDGSSITIYNSPTGVQFNMYDTQLKSNIFGEIETDNSSYIQMTYTKPVEREEVTEEIPEDTETEDTSVDYESYEEMMKALEQAEKEKQETVRYEIEILEFTVETQQMHMVLTNTDRTLDLTMFVDETTPDYSLENNEIVEDTVEAVIEDTIEE